MELTVAWWSTWIWGYWEVFNIRTGSSQIHLKFSMLRAKITSKHHHTLPYSSRIFYLCEEYQYLSQCINIVPDRIWGEIFAFLFLPHPYKQFVVKTYWFCLLNIPPKDSLLSIFKHGQLKEPANHLGLLFFVLHPSPQIHSWPLSTMLCLNFWPMPSRWVWLEKHWQENGFRKGRD